MAAATDEGLLADTATDPEAFAEFYRRHLPTVLAFLLRRTRDRELAADLAAETFAAALIARATFDPARGEARAWLCTIAVNKLHAALRRGRVEDAARRQLAMRPLAFTDEDLERVAEIADAARDIPSMAELLDAVAPDARAALQARVLDERDYPDIAAHLNCSEAVVRQRVSRGLRLLRTRLRDPR